MHFTKTSPYLAERIAEENNLEMPNKGMDYCLYIKDFVYHYYNCSNWQTRFEIETPKHSALPKNKNQKDDYMYVPFDDLPR